MRIISICLAVFLYASVSSATVNLDADNNGATDIDKGGTNATTAGGALTALGAQPVPSEGAFADGDKTKLDGIESGATGDQTAAEIAITDTNTFYTTDYLDNAMDQIAGVLAGLGSASTRSAEDTMTNGSNLPDGAAIIAYAAANGWGTGGSMVYPGAGIPVSTGSAWGTSYSLATLKTALGLDNSDLLFWLEGLVSLDLSSTDVTLDDSNALDVDITFETLNANGDVGPGTSQVAAGAHTHTGYQTTITFGTGVETALGVSVGSTGSPVINGGVGGTPSSITLSNGVDLPDTGLDLPPHIISSTRTLTDLHGNYIITGAYTVTLSAIESGDWGCFQVYGNYTARIDPNAADLIILDGVASTDGTAIASDGTTGSSVCVQVYDATAWISWGNNGWASE